jgi:hypothetical protein
VAAVVGLLACVVTARPARAQTLTGTAGTIGTTTPTTLAAADFFIGIQQPEGTNLNNFQLPRFFNKANCDCDEPVFVYVTLEPSGFAKRPTLTQTTSGKFQIWIGSECDQILLQPGRCTKLVDIPLATFMADGHVTTPAVSARVFSTDTTTLEATVDGGVTESLGTTFVPTPTCTTTGLSFQQTVWALIDVDGDGIYDVEPAPVQTLLVDLTPPPPPTNIHVSPGDEALSVTWTPVDFSTNMDLQGYQVLCQRAQDLQVFPTNTFGAYFETCSTTRLGDGLVSLAPQFACSPLLTTTASSFRVKILQNDIWYAASVVSIDNSGNSSPPVLVGPDGMAFGSFQKPEKTDSFYDVYRNGENTGAGPVVPQGAASGGFCAVGGGRSKAWTWTGIGAAALVAAALSRARRRRRR